MPDLERFLQAGQAAQRAVDELLGNVVHPHKPGQQCDACEGFCLVKLPVDRRDLAPVLALLDQSVKFGEGGDARMFDTTRQARAILKRLLSE